MDARTVAAFWAFIFFPSPVLGFTATISLCSSPLYTISVKLQCRMYWPLLSLCKIEHQLSAEPRNRPLADLKIVHPKTDTTAVVHRLLDPLRGPTPPQPVRCYQLTAEGQKYFRKIQGTFEPSTGFCYGQKTVDSIVKWTESEAQDKCRRGFAPSSPK